MAVEPVDCNGGGTSITPLDSILKGVSTHHAISSIYMLWAIYEINLEVNAVKTMGPYDPAEPLA